MKYHDKSSGMVKGKECARKVRTFIQVIYARSKKVVVCAEV